MNVNLFQDRENVIPGQALPSITKHYQALLSITKHYRALPSTAKHNQAIVGIIENQGNFTL